MIDSICGFCQVIRENVMERIATNRLDKVFFRYQDEFENATLRVLRSGSYILGEELDHFERGFAGYIGSRYCLGVASGLDALTIALKSLGIGIGDEVIVPANTFIASVLAITNNGATPVFVEPDEYYCIDAKRIEKSVNEKTKAIIVVHLYGQSADMTSIMRTARDYGLKVIEDCAQSHGSKWQGKTTGTFGDIGCFSFYPTKNIGAFGDGGAIVTDNEELYRHIKKYRNYGSERKYQNEIPGINSRLDEIQAALLDIKLSHISELMQERETIAQRYLGNITNELIDMPQVRDGSTHVWHQFVIRTRNRAAFMEHMEKGGVDTLIHYPIPPHLSKAYAYLGYLKGDYPVTESYADQVVSIPMYNGLSVDEQDRVIELINSF